MQWRFAVVCAGSIRFCAHVEDASLCELLRVELSHRLRREVIAGDDAENELTQLTDTISVHALEASGTRLHDGSDVDDLIHKAQTDQNGAFSSALCTHGTVVRAWHALS
jgi:hypothetical protein